MERKKSNVFSMRLKVARKAKKLSQERLGILAGIYNLDWVKDKQLN